MLTLFISAHDVLLLLLLLLLLLFTLFLYNTLHNQGIDDVFFGLVEQGFFGDVMEHMSTLCKQVTFPRRSVSGCMTEVDSMLFFLTLAVCFSVYGVYVSGIIDYVWAILYDNNKFWIDETTFHSQRNIPTAASIKSLKMDRRLCSLELFATSDRLSNYDRVWPIHFDAYNLSHIFYLIV